MPSIGEQLTDEQIKQLEAQTQEDLDQLTRVRELSIQKRAEEQRATLGTASIWWFVESVEGEIAPWWSPQRDRDLWEFYLYPGNDILQGAVSSMVKKFKSLNWTLDGPSTRRGKPRPGTVEYHQDVLSNAEYGEGWDTLLAKTLTDYYTRDNGAMWELIGEGDPDGALEGPVMGIAHLDSSLCTRTGDPVYPILFQNPKTNHLHKMHATRVVMFSDMPSPREVMHNVGFCSVSRVVTSSSVLLKLAQYKNEKLSDLPQAGLLLLNNIMPAQWEDVKAQHEVGRRRMGQQFWSNIMTLVGLDPAQPVSAEFLSFANLPEGFNERESIDLYANIVALSFGVDTREFWPLTGGPLGEGRESTIQHQKAKGKGVGEVVGMLERAINWKVLPSAVTFEFETQDDEEEQLKTDVDGAKIDNVMKFWRSVQMPDGTYSGPPVTVMEMRQMLADQVPDIFPEQFLLVDLTEETEVTDTDRAKMHKDGTLVPVGRKRKWFNPWGNTARATGIEPRDYPGLKEQPPTCGFSLKQAEGDEPPRGDYERQIERALAEPFAEMREEAISTLRRDEEPDYDKWQRRLMLLLIPFLMNAAIFQIRELEAEYALDFDDGEVQALALAWAQQRAAESAAMVTGTTQDVMARVRLQLAEGATLDDILPIIDRTFDQRRRSTIGTTETTYALSRGVSLYMGLAALLGVSLERIWYTRMDERVCPVCGELHGKNEDVWGMDYPDGPPAHPNCRCAVRTRIRVG